MDLINKGLFGSWFQGTVHCVRKGMVAGACHTESTARKQKAMKASAWFTYAFLCSPGSQQMEWYHPRSPGVFAPWLTQSRQPLTDTPKSLSPHLLCVWIMINHHPSLALLLCRQFDFSHYVSDFVLSWVLRNLTVCVSQLSSCFLCWGLLSFLVVYSAVFIKFRNFLSFLPPPMPSGAFFSSLVSVSGTQLASFYNPTALLHHISSIFSSFLMHGYSQ